MLRNYEHSKKPLKHQPAIIQTGHNLIRSSETQNAQNQNASANMSGNPTLPHIQMQRQTSSSDSSQDYGSPLSGGKWTRAYKDSTTASSTSSIQLSKTVEYVKATVNELYFDVTIADAGKVYAFRIDKEACYIGTPAEVLDTIMDALRLDIDDE